MHRDPNTLDLSQQKLCLASDLKFWPIHQRGELVYRIEIPKLHKFFRVGYEEYVLLSLLDGKTTLPQACGLAAAKLGKRAPTTSDATTIARWLIANELAHLPSVPSPSRTVKRSSDHGVLKSLGKWNPFWIKVPLAGSTLIIDRASRFMSALFCRAATLVGVLLIAAAMVVLASHWAEFSASSAALYLPGNWFGILVAWVVLKVVHEFAHAVACRRLGGEVYEAGMVFVLLAPLAYVDVSSCWRMNSRWARIAVASAGMYVELLIAAIAVFAWLAAPSDAARFLLFQVIVTAGVSTLLFNANVLMRFDGYFILADLIDVPNLAAEGSASVRRSLAWILTGKDSNQPTLGSWRQPFVLFYGIAAILWRVVVCTTLFMAASAMFSGAGIVIAMLGMGLWLGPPIKVIVDAIRRQLADGVFASLRPLLIGTGLLVAIGWLVIVCPVPTSIGAPAVVQFLPETVVRAQAAGFVRVIHVGDGENVKQGQVLLDLENHQLTNRLASMELTRQQNEIRLRQATEEHDSASEQLIRRNQISLDEQLMPLRRQVAALKVLAPRSGRVIAPMLSQRIGDYTEEGESMLIVAADTDKEIVAVIGQEVVEDSRSYLGQQIRILDAGGQSLRGRLERIEPRATDRLPSPAMAVTEGGSLAVRRADFGDNDAKEDVASMRLIEPAFRGRVSLHGKTAMEIPAGTRVTALLGYHAESLASRWKNRIRELWFQVQRAN
ncbi:HlyD family secretion protein [Rubripirellula obstinata]|uniref:HlyD family secretion protein n=2 Tax=Rubripirellula obstinata TaxID=406547 RepID=A0A5B1CBH5_9BACT|nr:HlyD family secretion protein [Rubripirellula obstinata]